MLTEAIAQVPARHRRDLLVTVDGAGAILELIRHISTLNAMPGHRVHYSVGFDLDHRARTAIGHVTESAWQHLLDRDGLSRDLDGTGMVELTGLLRTSFADELANWPADMRSLCRRERPSSGGAAVSAGGDRRVALPTDRHQCPRQAVCVPGDPSPLPRPRGGLHPGALLPP